MVALSQWDPGFGGFLRVCEMDVYVRHTAPSHLQQVSYHRISYARSAFPDGMTVSTSLAAYAFRARTNYSGLLVDGLYPQSVSVCLSWPGGGRVWHAMRPCGALWVLALRSATAAGHLTPSLSLNNHHRRRRCWRLRTPPCAWRSSSRSPATATPGSQLTSGHPAACTACRSTTCGPSTCRRLRMRCPS